MIAIFIILALGLAVMFIMALYPWNYHLRMVIVLLIPSKAFIVHEIDISIND
jgi:hypothetical protein